MGGKFSVMKTFVDKFSLIVSLNNLRSNLGFNLPLNKKIKRYLERMLSTL